MLINDDWRAAMGHPDRTDTEIDEFLADLDVFLRQFLDDYFKELHGDEF